MSVSPIPQPRPGQHQPGEAPTTPAPSRRTRFSGVRGWFGRRLADLDLAATYGWRLTATWIKTVAVISGVLAAVFTAHWIGTTVLDLAHALPWPLPNDPTGLLATVDEPVRHYLATHTHALPVTAATAYSTWQAVGAVSLLLGFFFRSTGARLTWTAWGAATVAMVGAGTPGPGRQVAAGITLLAWAVLSLFALRGLSLSPAAFVHVDVHNQAPPAPQVRAEIHLPKAAPTTRKPYNPPQPPSWN